MAALRIARKTLGFLQYWIHMVRDDGFVPFFMGAMGRPSFFTNELLYCGVLDWLVADGPR